MAITFQSTILLPIILVLLPFTTTTNAQVFDIRKYGAKGDGKTDTTQALLSAWKKACASNIPSKVVIPTGTFLLREVILQGPCKAPIAVHVQGTVKAPMNPSQFKTDGWVTFKHINGFTLFGGGTFDGQGKMAWTKNDCHKSHDCKTLGMLPINLRFDFVSNGMIDSITTRDSKQFHVNVLGCKNVTFRHFTVSAPDESPNTDGIHIGRSNKITITESNIKTGDDCISLGDGSRQIFISKVRCGPGHGISVGSLGKYKNEEPVEGLIVKNCTLSNTQNGVRIKTWPASQAGTVSDMHFENILMNNVGNPVIIDQLYCPWNHCNAKIPSSVKISKVSFKGIYGTSSTPIAVKMVCSKQFPCQNVEIGNIDLKYTGLGGRASSVCANVKPVKFGKQNPLTCAKVAV